MTHRCLDLESLAALAALPADDPRRLEAAACPRCDSLMAAATAFLAGDETIPEAELADAERRLAAAVPSFTRRAPDARRSRLQRLGAVVAAVAAVVVAVLVLVPSGPPTPSGTVRGGGHVSGLPELGPVTVSAVSPESATHRLDWPAVAAADSYAVVLFAADLDTIATVGVPSGPPVAVDDPAAAFARVRALAGGTPVAESALLSLRVP